MWSLDTGCILGNTLPIGRVPLQLDRWVMEQVGEKVGRIKNEEASRGKTVEGRDGQEEEKPTEGPLRNYPWWSPATMIGKTTGSSDKMEDTASLFEGKNMRV